MPVCIPITSLLNDATAPLKDAANPSESLSRVTSLYTPPASPAPLGGKISPIKLERRQKLLCRNPHLPTANSCRLSLLTPSPSPKPRPKWDDDFVTKPCDADKYSRTKKEDIVITMRTRSRGSNSSDKSTRNSSPEMDLESLSSGDYVDHQRISLLDSKYVSNMSKRKAEGNPGKKGSAHSIRNAYETESIAFTLALVYESHSEELKEALSVIEILQKNSNALQRAIENEKAQRETCERNLLVERVKRRRYEEAIQRKNCTILELRHEIHSWDTRYNNLESSHRDLKLASHKRNKFEADLRGHLEQQVRRLSSMLSTDLMITMLEEEIDLLEVNDAAYDATLELPLHAHT
ncbi:hypothetical protein K7432_001422 [Basidiobolus ranarum]|uniref:Uncharacterized protein n=1 Tax=Basidiobolus ranarum TaxID=34480 RepID=A0ABR2W9M2_9FUNG